LWHREIGSDALESVEDPLTHVSGLDRLIHQIGDEDEASLLVEFNSGNEIRRS
jgi:hypothetical protein